LAGAEERGISSHSTALSAENLSRVTKTYNPQSMEGKPRGQQHCHQLHMEKTQLLQHECPKGGGRGPSFLKWALVFKHLLLLLLLLFIINYYFA
jgi:hypothetical protein